LRQECLREPEANLKPNFLTHDHTAGRHYVLKLGSIIHII